ncbi:MAG: flagellar motor switch protein FliN [Planctomycetota bacterium]
MAGEERKVEPSDDAGRKKAIDALLDEAKGKVDGVLGGAGPRPPAFESFDTPESPGGGKGTLDLLMEVPLDVKIELGRSHMNVEDILRLAKGSVIGLDKLAGDPVDVLVNGKLVARGEVVVLNDNFCVRITEIMSPKERLEDVT